MADFQAGKNDLALKYLEIARRLDPAHVSHPQPAMAEIHLRRNQRTAATADLEDSSNITPTGRKPPKCAGPSPSGGNKKSLRDDRQPQGGY